MHPAALIEPPASSYDEYETQLVAAAAAAAEAREADLSSYAAHQAYASAVTLAVGAYDALPPADRSTELGGDLLTLTHGLINSQRVKAALARMSPEDAELWVPTFDAAVELHRRHLKSTSAADEPRMATHKSALRDLEAARDRVAKVASPVPEKPEPDPEPVAKEEYPEPPPPVATPDTQTDASPPSRRGLVIGLAAGGGVLVAASIGTLVGGLSIRNSRDSAEAAYRSEGVLEEPEVVTFLDDESRRVRSLFIATGVLAGVGLGAVVAAVLVKKRAAPKRQATRQAPQVAATSSGFQIRF